MYRRQYKAICQFKCKNNTYFHEIIKRILAVDSILGVSALFTSKFITKYFFHDFEIYMEKITFVSIVKKHKPLNRVLILYKVTIIHTLETANSTLNVDWRTLQIDYLVTLDMVPCKAMI